MLSFVGRAWEPGLPDREVCVEAVLARESLIGTGTGRGVAIPHASLEGLERPVLVFGRSVQGIEWDSPE